MEMIHSHTCVRLILSEPTYFGPASSVYHLFSYCTHRNTNTGEARPHPSLPFIPWTNRDTLIICLFCPSLVISLHLCHLVPQENLLRLVHIEYSLKGKRDLLKAGRVSSAIFVILSAFEHNNIPEISTERLSDELKARWSMFLTFLKVFPFVCLQMFVKEGTLMKVLKKSRLPRHLFLVLFSPILFIS